MKTYSTKDFYLTVYLLCKGFNLIGSHKESDGVHFTVQVHNEKLLGQLIDDYIQYKATVNLRKSVKVTALLRGELDKHK